VNRKTRRVVGVAVFWTCAFFTSQVCAPVPNNNAQWITYETPLGPSRHIAFGDDSFVDLNTSTRIRVLANRAQVTAPRKPPDPYTQMMILEGGEAYFRGGSTPLRVSVGDMTINADKASFSVRDHGSGDAEIMSLGGRLEISSARRVQWTLSAGGIATMRAGTISFHTVGNADLKRKLMWRYGMLEFVNEPIEDIAQDFNRYSRTKLIIDDVAVRKLRLGGRFSEYDLESFITTACQVFGLHSLTRQTPTGPIVQLRSGRDPNTRAP